MMVARSLCFYEAQLNSLNACI